MLRNIFHMANIFYHRFFGIQICFFIRNKFSNKKCEVSSKELNGILTEVFSIWQLLKLGRITIKQKNPLTISIHGCYGCKQIPNEEDIIECKFVESVLKTVIDRNLGTDSSVKSISHYGKAVGKKRCWFVITKISS